MRPRVWVYETRAVDRPLDGLDGLLCPARLDALRRIRHARARACSLTGDLLLCEAVRRVQPDCPFPLVRAAHPSGQPYLPDAPNLYVSLSHSGEIVLCALADVPVGIDLELPRPVRPGLAERWFFPDEIALLARDQAAFFDLWMAKEAVLKETGIGLHGGLRAVSVALTPSPHLAQPFDAQPHTLLPVALSQSPLRAMVSVGSAQVPLLSHTVVPSAKFL